MSDPRLTPRKVLDPETDRNFREIYDLLYDQKQAVATRDGLFEMVVVNGILMANGGVDSNRQLYITAAQDIILAPRTGYVVPPSPYSTSIGRAEQRFRELWASELRVETLVAESVSATLGGRVLVGPTAVLGRDLLAADTALYVRQSGAFTNGDWVYLESEGISEQIKITSSQTPTYGLYGYTITRTSPQRFSTGAAVFNTGQTGQGFIDLYAKRSIRSSDHFGPTIVGNVRTADTNFLDYSEHWAIGNLRGIYGYGSNTIYGVGLGKYTGGTGNAYLTIDPTNGIRMFGNGVLTLQITPAGSATFSGVVSAGSFYAEYPGSSGTKRIRINGATEAGGSYGTLGQMGFYDNAFDANDPVMMFGHSLTANPSLRGLEILDGIVYAQCSTAQTVGWFIRSGGTVNSASVIMATHYGTVNNGEWNSVLNVYSAFGGTGTMYGLVIQVSANAGGIPWAIYSITGNHYFGGTTTQNGALTANSTIAASGKISNSNGLIDIVSASGASRLLVQSAASNWAYVQLYCNAHYWDIRSTNSAYAQGLVFAYDNSDKAVLQTTGEFDCVSVYATGVLYAGGRGLFATGTNNDPSYTNSSLELREATRGNSGSYDAPHLSFHWGGVVAAQMTIESTGRLAMVDSAGTSYADLAASRISAYKAGTNGALCVMSGWSVSERPQIRLGHDSTDYYAQFISTQHNGGGASSNTIVFWTSDGTQQGTFPTNAIKGLTVTNGSIIYEANVYRGAVKILGSQESVDPYTTDSESGSYTGINNSQGGTVYAQVSDMNNLRTAYENLRASHDDIRTALLNHGIIVSS
jgi:hypothetical protein